MKHETAEFTYKVTIQVKYIPIDPEYLDGEIREPDVTNDTVAEYLRTLLSLAGDEGYFHEHCSAEPVDIDIEVD